MKKINEDAIIERIRQLRRQYAGERGKSRFARALGISPSTYSYYESNRLPPVDVLVRISQVTGADLQWLLTGSTSSGNTTAALNQPLIEKLHSLLARNPELTDAVSSFVDLLCEKKGIERQFESSSGPTSWTKPGWIPVLGRTAAGMVHFWNQQLLPQRNEVITELEGLVEKHLGKAIVGSEDAAVTVDLQKKTLLENLQRREVNLVQVSGSGEDIVEFVECKSLWNIFPDSFALRIDGDSMSPRINDGDVVVISPSVPATDGQIAIARLVNQIGVTCKLIRTSEDQVHLIPINEKYETKIVPKKDLLWALAVLCHVGKK